MDRLENYKLYLQSILNIKINRYAGDYVGEMCSVTVTAGLYKPGSITFQHNLIFASVVGKPPLTSYQTHGKRLKRTVSLSAKLSQHHIFPVLSKLTYEILPILSDFKTPKWKKNNTSHSYTLRIRQRFTYYDEFEDLISNQMHEGHKGVFLPLDININFTGSQSHVSNEIYLRLIHLPVSMFKRKLRPAFDDSVSFE